LSFDTTHKQVQNINSYGCRPLEIGRKIVDLSGWKARAEHTTLEEITTTQDAVIQIEAEAGTETKTDLCIVYFTREIHTIE
jgi:hypothetical protein